MAEQRVLIYDRIDQNRRNTFFLMFLFVLLVAGFATAIGIVVGLPPQIAAIVAVPVLLFALFSYLPRLTAPLPSLTWTWYLGIALFCGQDASC